MRIQGPCRVYLHLDVNNNNNNNNGTSTSNGGKPQVWYSTLFAACQVRAPAAATRQEQRSKCKSTWPELMQAPFLARGVSFWCWCSTIDSLAADLNGWEHAGWRPPAPLLGCTDAPACHSPNLLQRVSAARVLPHNTHHHPDRSLSSARRVFSSRLLPDDVHLPSPLPPGAAPDVIPRPHLPWRAALRRRYLAVLFTKTPRVHSSHEDEPTGRRPRITASTTTSTIT